jgi:23S rRNA (adenine2503-C2)-methyltransferase
MRTLPPSARRRLAEAFAFSTVGPQLKRAADRGQTVKYLFKLADAKTIETVVMHYEATARSRARTTICVSSQVGCPIGCSFCATGQSGFDRNLSEAEIVDQFLAASRDLGETQRSLTNVVFMGMGEPLNNASRVFDAVRLLNDPERLGIGARHITVSTSGVVPAIDRMIGELPQVNLAISLHAADDDLRDELVPINRKWPLASVIDAGRRFAAETGRRVSLEYVMIDELNDTPLLAERLAAVAAGWLSHVNLIPLNPTPGSRWSGSPRVRINAFAAILRAAGVPVTIRDTRGREIEAACGQLHAQLAGRALPRPPVAIGSARVGAA